MEDRTSSEVWLNAGCKLSFEVKVAKPMIFMLRPRSGPSQWVAAEEYDLSLVFTLVLFVSHQQKHEA